MFVMQGAASTYIRSNLDSDIGAVGTVSMIDCTLGTIIVTFTGAPGVVYLDGATYSQWIDNGCSVVNGTISVGNASIFTNLSNVLVVDIGTVVPAAERNGNIESPFITITDAIAAATVGDTIAIMPGIYDTPPGVSSPITINKSLILQGLNERVPVGGITINAGPLNVRIINISSPADAVDIASGSLLSTTNGTFNAGITGDGDITADNSTFIGGVACAVFAGTNCTLVGNITLTGISCSFSGGTFFGAPVITFFGAPGTLALNDGAYEIFMRAGGTVVNGIITRNDAEQVSWQYVVCEQCDKYSNRLSRWWYQ